jgi:hypothetical protein
MATTKTAVAEVQRIKVVEADVKIKGLSPLIMHRWSEKARKEMLDKQMKKTVKKEAKSPEEQYEASVYRFNDGRIGFPADAFKKAMIRGAKQIGLVMTDARTSFFVHGEYCERDDRDLVEITGDVQPREDMVRLNGSTADIRFRGQVLEWSATLHISYNESITSFDHIVNMLVAAGYGVGVGEWRPEKDGTFGRFEVVTD